MAGDRFKVISKAVTTAGAAEAISDTDLWVSWILIEWDETNSGSNVYRGDADVDNTYPTITSTKSFSWSSAGDNLNLADIYLDVDSSGDSVWVTYGKSQTQAAEDN